MGRSTPDKTVDDQMDTAQDFTEEDHEDDKRININLASVSQIGRAAMTGQQFFRNTQLQRKMQAIDNIMVDNNIAYSDLNPGRSNGAQVLSKKARFNEILMSFNDQYRDLHSPDGRHSNFMSSRAITR